MAAWKLYYAKVDVVVAISGTAAAAVVSEGFFENSKLVVRR